MKVKELKEVVRTLPDYADDYEVVFGYCCAYCPVSVIEVGEEQIEICV